MAYINTRVQPSRPQLSQPQGWFRRAISTVRDALTGPTVSTQTVRRGEGDYMVKGAPLDVNSRRRHDHLLAGHGADNSRGLKSIPVGDHILIPFLDDMGKGKYG